ncbi:calcium/sodium antiporter [Halomarina litorea]|uniref:calcium/sodium antiporter n=1 Tax=Halomarina litorea TaxID=2961595 RepID=UPI0020C2F0DA|nr:calcium/sodium antiporter [Halomarina sp. BCD28]
MVDSVGVVVDVVVLVASVGALWLGATLFVDHATRLARRAGVSDLVVGLTVVSVGTSAPEFAVAVDAALVGRPDLAVGGVVGSNLFNFGILGGVVLLAGTSVAVPRELVRRDGPMVLLATALVLWFVRDLRFSSVEGGVLLVLFVVYLVVLFVRGADLPPESAAAPARWFSPLLAVAGIVAIAAGANGVVSAASDLARLLGVSEWVIGVTVVAIGTSSPEIAASVVAARRGFATIAVGNVLGSNLFNLLGVLGVAAVVAPLPVADEAVGQTAWLLGLSVVAVGLVASGRRLSRPEGSLLLGAVLVRWALDLL